MEKEGISPHEIARDLTYKAMKHLRSVENIRKAINWVVVNPADFAIRIEEMERVSERLQFLLTDPTIESSPHYTSHYPNLIKLKRMLGDTLPLSLGQVVGAVQSERSVNQEEAGMTEAANNTIFAVKEKISSGEWQFVTQETDANKLASALSIESFGVFVGTAYGELGQPDIAETTVFAFEEVMLMEYPSLTLLSDVIDYMKADKDKFSPAIARQLERM